MKFKVTRKTIRENYPRVASVRYCQIQHLLYYQSPIAYSAGIDGWHCDYYDIDGVLISTGYNPLSDKDVKKIKYDILEQFESRAKEINNDSSMKHDERKTAINALLLELINLWR